MKNWIFLFLITGLELIIIATTKAAEPVQAASRIAIIEKLKAKKVMSIP